MNRRVSVIIPARDEANSIGSLISRIKESLSAYSYEIIVVDDGSRDGTREVAQSKGSIVVSHEKSRGKSIAMKTGVENAEGEIIVFIDGDGAHNPDDMPNIIAPILQNKADLIIGSRVLPESKAPVSPLTRRLSNNVASIIISVIISFLLPLVTLFKCRMGWIRITDSQCGFKAIKKEVWQKLELSSRGFEIESEIIYEAARNRLTIKEVPINCNCSSKFSHLSILWDGLRTLKLLAGKLIGDIGGR